MAELQTIVHNGRLSAAVAGQAIIRDSVPDRDLPTIKAMCLYALEVADGRIPGPLQHRSGARLRARGQRGAQLILSAALQARSVQPRP